MAPESTPEVLTGLLSRQREAFLATPMPSAELRIDRIRRLEALLVNKQKTLCEAIDHDFGGRPHMQTRMEILGTLGSIRHAIKHLHAWMKPEKRPVPLLLRLLGAKAQVFYQPLGVVGVVSPWNFPYTLSLGALASVFAAGNRAMLKPSELSPQTSTLLKELLDASFDPAELATVLGGPDTGVAFCALPFDHLLFTGAPSVAKHVMRAAAENLVPVTLELGGKCPVIIGAEADLALAVERVLNLKLQNAGQICLAPDYVFVQKGREEEFVSLARAQFAKWYSAIFGNPDFCSVINARHHARLTSYLDEARQRGARVEVLGPGDAQNSDRRIAPTLIVEPADDLAVMQDEIFGPMLPIKTYSHLDEVIDFINARPRPLAIYYFGSDAAAIRDLKERTTSGGMSINDIAMHAAIESLPLGGVGNSGMGAYHGRDGFVNFSHAKAVFRQGRINLGRLFNPPYTAKQYKMLDRAIGAPLR